MNKIQLKNSLDGKVVVITGASRGLGKSLAQALAKKGAKLVISGRSEKDLKDVAKETGAIPVVADVTKEGDVIALAKAAYDKFGHIDIWINNAGLWLPKSPVGEIDMKKAHELIEVNLFGTIYGSRVAIENMKDSGGTIVNIISTAGLQGRSGQSIYSASKHALRGFTDSIRLELAENVDTAAAGITVIGVYPGGIKTNFFDAAKPADFDDFMSPDFVADKIIENLEKEKPETEQILKRPGQTWNKPASK